MGIFWAATQIELRRGLPDWARGWLNERLAWFNENLPAPTFDEPDARAIFWFNPKSEAVREMWQLVAVLRAEDVPIRLRYTNTPGRIVYHDRHQIAAIPYGHGRRIRQRRPPRFV